MVRTQLYLPEDLHRRLRGYARERGTTISALVRQALEQVYAEGVSARTWSGAVDAVKGLWVDRDDIDDEWCRLVRAGSRRLREMAGGGAADE